MRDIDIDDESKYHLGDLIENNKLLKIFDISENKLSNDGVKVVFEAYGKNEVMRSLLITNNPIDYQASRMIRKIRCK